ncbi:hypothetical protein OGY18_03810 [Citrobacter sp. Cpo142]|uniref:hypothetical protein n=1 Tax=Citrobacter TaxID=544 RepID=UPI001DF7002E|nr:MULTISPECIES: hypothetical protein [Citrobacter]EDC2614171.1 hypothetical protein [Salmonella enterica]ELQ2289847.1 hypothetical protein [Escherichia coli]HCW0179525.1 hypothetical protein [Citrobacter freundii]MDM2776287.1 hypothetical protein [Citrobacter sp. Cpo142]MDT7467607.1 hypothetical protein [Citrobacter portucalensis]
MTKLVPIFLLKTDITDIRIPFLATPCGYMGTEAVVLPVVEESVDHYHKHNGSSIDDTLIISLRRNFSAREIRGFISLYVKEKKTFLLFMCDSTQRSDLVMNTIKSIYGTENISLFRVAGSPGDGAETMN